MRRRDSDILASAEKRQARQHRSKSVDTVKVFDKIKWKTVLPVALVFICAAQSMAFFAQEAVFAYSYSILSAFGATFMELSTLILPIHFARVSKFGYGAVASGDGLFYGGFCFTSSLFVFIGQPAYLYMAGEMMTIDITNSTKNYVVTTYSSKRTHEAGLDTSVLGNMYKLSGDGIISLR